MLQQMRGLAKYIWVLVALVFVGGFLLYETSGLMGRTPVTASTAVAVVNGHEIPYNVYIARVQNEIQAAQQRDPSRALSQDDNRRIENSVFDQMVAEILLNGRVPEARHRRDRRRNPRIRALRSAAMDHQRAGTADERPVRSREVSALSGQRPGAPDAGCSRRSSSTTAAKFRARSCSIRSRPVRTRAIAELWRAWRDQHDSAQVSYVAFLADAGLGRRQSDLRQRSARAISTSTRPSSRAQAGPCLTVVTIPKVITAADTAAARARRSGDPRGDRRRVRSSRTSPSASRRTACPASRAAISARAARAASFLTSRRQPTRSRSASSRSRC